MYFSKYLHKDIAAHKEMGITVTGRIENPVGIYIDTANRELDKTIQVLGLVENATLKVIDRFNILEDRALGLQKALKLI